MNPLMHGARSSVQDIFSGGGEMGSLMRGYDWAATPLGSPGEWPPSLRAAVRIVLLAPYPMLLWWGPERTTLYNDAAIPLHGAGHPRALGRPATRVWADAWPALGPRADRVLAEGSAAETEAVLLTRDRDGRAAEMSVTFSLHPAPDDAGGVGGVLVICTAEPARLVDERRPRPRGHAAVEEALQAREEQYRVLFESMDQGYCVIEVLFDAAGAPVDYRFLEVNPAFEALTGLAGAVGRTARELVPDLEAHWFEIYGRVASTGTPARFVDEARSMDGRWFDVHAFRIGGRDSRKVALLFTNITERKRTEEAMRAGEARLRLALDVARVGTWSWEPARDQVVADLRCREICGLNPAAPLVLDDLVSRVHPDDWPRVAAALEAALRPDGPGAHAAEFRLVHADGTTRWVQSRGQTLFAGEAATRQPTQVLGTVLDITERKRAEAALVESEVYFRDLADNAPVMIWMTDPDAVCTYLNRGWYDATGQTPATGLGLGWLNATHPDDAARVAKTLLAATARREAFSLEYRLRRDDGAYRWVIEAGQPRFDQQGVFLGFIGTATDIHERKQAEEALQASHQLNEDVLNSMSAHIAVLSKDGEIMLVNESWRRFALENGADWTLRGVGVGTNYLEVCRSARGEHADEAEAMLQGLSAVLSGARASYTLEYPCHSPTTQRWFLLTASPLTHASGGAVVSHQNITERRLAEAALRASEARFRFLDAVTEATRTAVDPAAVMATTTRLLGEHLGAAICAYADVEPDEDEFTIRRAWTAGGVPSIAGVYRLDGFGAIAAGLLRSGRPLVAGDLVAELGAEQAALFVALGIRATICFPLVKAGRLTAMMAVHQAVPRAWTADEVALVGEVAERSWAHIERVRAEAALRASEDRLRAAGAAGDVGTWRVDLRTNLDTRDANLNRLLGLEAVESTLPVTDFISRVHEEDRARVEAEMRRAIDERGQYYAECRVVRPDGEVRWLLDQGAVIEDEGGVPAFMTGAAVDITERKGAEAEREWLLEAERAARAEAEEAVRARDTFLSIAAHELKTPVTGLKAMAQLLQRRLAAGGADPARLARTLGALDGAADRLVRLIDDLLDVARIRTGHLSLTPRPSDPVALVRAVVDRVGETIGTEHRLILEARGGLVAVMADPDRLDQVLTNLLDNAVKYSPDGGEITVTARAAGERVEISVRDTGIGLPAGTAEAIFEPFGRAANAAASHLPGMGLGLHICRTIIERHGGAIWAESGGEGRGTIVTFWVPTAPGPAA